MADSEQENMKNSEDLKGSEREYYRLISENSMVLIAILNKRMEHEYINEEAYMNVLGYTKDELIGKKPWKLIHPEDFANFENIDHIKKYGTEGLIPEFRQELRLRHKNGHYIWVESINKVFTSSKGESKIFTVSRDISDRKETELKLKEKNLELSILNKIITLGNESTSLQEFLEKAYDHVLDSVEFDRGGVYIYNVETQHNFLVCHKNVHHDFIAAVEDVDISKGLFKTIFDKEEPFYIEDFSKYIKNSKDLGIFSAVIVPLRSKDEYVGSLNIGSSIHQVLSNNELELLVAIGKQMGIIIQKFESEKLLKESEEKYRLLADNINDMIWTMDLDLNITYVSPSVNSILGYTIQEDMDRSINDKFTPDSLKKIANIFKEQVRGENITNPNFNPVFTLEVDQYHKNGSIVPMEVRVNPIRDENGIAIGLVGITRDITERKKTERKLKESEEKYKSLFEFAGDAIFLMSFSEKDGPLFVDCNERTLKLFGCSKIEEIIGKSPIIFSPEIQPDGQSSVEKALKLSLDVMAGYPQFFEWKHDRLDGTSFDVEVNLKRIMLDYKYFMIAIVRDITERKKAEQKLKESEERWHTLVEEAPDIIINVDPEGKILYINKTPEGITPEGAIGTNVLDYVSPEYVETVKNSIEQVFQTGNPSNYEITARGAYDTISWFSTRLGAIKHNHKVISVMLITGNITERKKEEEGLIESEEKFRIITEQSFLGIIIVQDNQVKYANEATAKILEYSTEELIGMSIDYLTEKNIHPEDLPSLRDRFRVRIRSGEVTPYSAYRVFTKSGELRWVEEYSKFILYQGKEALLTSIMDITEKREAEKLIIEENKKLLELDEMRKEMITRISHELKTPLTSVFGAIQLLLEDSKEKSSDLPQVEILEVANRGAIRLKKLIQNLLDASLLDSQKIKLHIQRENISEIVALCIHEIMGFVDNRKLTIISELPNDIFLGVDKLRLGQAIINLLSNAVKNTPKYGEILASVINHHKYIDIRIKDTGVGITTEEKERLFKKFGKIERYGLNMDVDIEGSGLGLYISKEIVELHGGKILLESKGRDKGSQFTIRLVKND